MAFDEGVRNRLKKCGAIPVLTIENPDHATDVAQSLLDGGIEVMEITLRTEAAFEALSDVTANVPEIFVGVGTVLDIGQVKKAVDAGAAFGVSPGLNPQVIETAAELNLPFAPGILTPSELEQAVSLECNLLKFFPAEPSGGVNYLKSMAAPYSHLGLEYIPLGGVSPDNIQEYLNRPDVPAVGGSWLAPKSLIRSNDWKSITRNAREATELVRKIREE
jgi:2-dehydro-3-deoxyphosphogluconate aldolase/(4S)-4-hydroxy-2-oxoglutarate aldolase